MRRTMKTKKVKIIQTGFPKLGKSLPLKVVGETGEVIGVALRSKNLSLTGNPIEIEIEVNEDYFLTADVDTNNLEKPTAGKKKDWKDI
jgi:hypothetical protein